MDDNDAFERLANLLPSYVNGTIADVDRQELEEALTGSPQLQHELERERAVARGVRDAIAPQIEQAEEHREERLRALTEGLPPKEAAQTLDSTASQAPQGNPLAFLNPANWRPAIALSLALAAMGGFSAMQAHEIGDLEAENFRLASGECEDESVVGVIVEFVPDAKWEAILAVIDQEGLTIASSGAFGSLVLRQAAENEDPTELANRLRKLPIVASAEPAA